MKRATHIPLRHIYVLDAVSRGLVRRVDFEYRVTSGRALVSRTVYTLEEYGFLRLSHNGDVRLTPAGESFLTAHKHADAGTEAS